MKRKTQGNKRQRKNRCEKDKELYRGERMRKPYVPPEEREKDKQVYRDLKEKADEFYEITETPLWCKELVQ